MGRWGQQGLQGLDAGPGCPRWMQVGIPGHRRPRLTKGAWGKLFCWETHWRPPDDRESGQKAGSKPLFLTPVPHSGLQTITEMKAQRMPLDHDSCGIWWLGLTVRQQVNMHKAPERQGLLRLDAQELMGYLNNIGREPNTGGLC